MRSGPPALAPEELGTQLQAALPALRTRVEEKGVGAAVPVLAAASSESHGWSEGGQAPAGVLGCLGLGTMRTAQQRAASWQDKTKSQGSLLLFFLPSDDCRTLHV